MRRRWTPRLVAAAAALLFGLWGLSWNLPNRQRLAWVLPPGLDTPEFRQNLEQSWKDMHRMLGPNLMLVSEELTNFAGLQLVAAPWKEPPQILVNCIRSFYLRSAHDDEQTFLILFSKMNPKRLDFKPRMFL